MQATRIYYDKYANDIFIVDGNLQGVYYTECLSSSPRVSVQADPLDSLISRYWVSVDMRTQFFVEEEAFLQASLPEELKPYCDQIKAFKEGVKAKKLTPISMYVFCDRDTLTFWAVIQELDVEIEMQYGDIFLDLYDQYPDKKFDLMTFGKNEFDFVKIPSEARLLSF